MIEVRVWEDIVTGDRHFEGVVHLADLRDIKLDPLERMQMNEPAKTASDIFLDLHTLAFRQEQQTKATEVEV